MYTILYVDDEETLLEVGKIFLEQDPQFSVDTITSAKAALDLMEKKHYDAIIADYQMPVMDGIGFLKKVRESGNTVPFILFTGRGREEIVIQALNEGADFYLQKGGDPVPQFAELAHKIRQAVQQRRAEASIRDYEHREQEIFNFLPDATLAIDTNGVVIAWNRAIEEMTGVPASRMLGKGDHEYAIPFYGDRRPILIDLLFTPEEEIKTRYSQIVRDGTMLAAETTLPKVKGMPRTLWGKASLLYDKDGKVSGAIETIRDITERKAAEAELLRARDALEERVNQRTADLYAANMALKKEIENRKLIDSALQESEERFRTLIEKAPEAVLLYDTDENRTIVANAAAEKLFGTSREELLRTGFERFYVPDQPDGKPVSVSFADHRRRVLDGEELTFERRIRNARGEERVVEARLVRLPSPDKNLVRVSFSDITGHKQAEDLLRQSEERYRTIVEHDYKSILEHMQDVFYRTDTRGILTLISPSGAALLGYDSTGEMIGRPANGFYAFPEERDAFLARLMKERSVRDVEVILRKKDGSVIPVSTSSHLWYDADGRYAGVEGIFRDITGLKEIREELRQAEEQYRVLVRHIQDGAFLSQDGILNYCNEAFAAMIGYTVDEVTGRPIEDLIAPEDRAMVMERQRARLAGKTLEESYEFRMLHKDGTTRVPVRMSVGIGTYRNRAAVIGTLRDVTRDREREYALRESEEKYRKLFEESNDAIIVAEALSRQITDCNRKAEALTGRSRNELIGMQTDLLHPPEVRQRTMERFREFAAGGDRGVETTVLTRDGRTVPVWINGGKFEIAGRLFMIGIFHDITERKKAGDALLRANRQLNLLSSVTRHDVVNQLTALSGFVGLAKQRCDDAAFLRNVGKQEEIIARIRQEILFTGEYQEIGKQAPAWQPVADRVRSAAADLDRGGVVLAVESLDQVEIYADPLLRKVFFNLIENALRHGGEGLRTIRFSGRRDGDRFVIACEDDGPGVPAGEKERIFGHGYGKHTGHGLFLVREILATTGLTIAETGEPEKGARFEITVPGPAFRIRENT